MTVDCFDSILKGALWAYPSALIKMEKLILFPKNQDLSRNDDLNGLQRPSKVHIRKLGYQSHNTHSGSHNALYKKTIATETKVQCPKIVNFAFLLHKSSVLVWPQSHF